MERVRRGWALLPLALMAALLAGPSPAHADGSPHGPIDGAASGQVTCGRVPVVPGQMRCFSIFTPMPTPPASSSTAPSTAPSRVHSFATTTTRTQGWTPPDIASLYGLPPIEFPVAVGSGPTVAVVEAGTMGTDASDSLEAQLAAYRTAEDLGTCDTSNGCLTIMSQRGSTSPGDLPTADLDWGGEMMMDVEAVSAACPDCRILVVEADSDDGTGRPDLETAMGVAADHASYVSMSFGSDDDGMRYSDVRSTEAIFTSHPDVTFVASSGDFGWSTYAPSYGAVCGQRPVYASGDSYSCTSYPASSTHVIAAGGTVATATTSDGGTTWSQRAWDPDDGTLNGGGASSGCSGWASMPAAQQLSSQALAACGTSARGTADLSALADGFEMFFHDGVDPDWGIGGGTSLSAPLLAAMYARAGNHTRPFDVYARAAGQPGAFSDVVAGSTRGCDASRDTLHKCSAGTGWDGPTGLGTPHGLASLQPYTAAPVPAPGAAPVAAPIGHSGAVRVRGKARVHRRLTAAYGAFEPGATPAVTWLVDGKPVAHGSRLRVRKRWLHHRIAYVVTAIAAGRPALTLTAPAVRVRR